MMKGPNFSQFSRVFVLVNLECSDGWAGPFADNCYKTYDLEEDWASAEQFCSQQASSGHLVSITSEAEVCEWVHFEKLTCLWHFIQSNHVRKVIWDGVGEDDRKDYWIGLSDRFGAGDWRWEDGSDYHFSAWNEGGALNFLITVTDGIEIFQVNQRMEVRTVLDWTLFLAAGGPMHAQPSKPLSASPKPLRWKDLQLLPHQVLMVLWTQFKCRSKMASYPIFSWLRRRNRMGI